MYIAIFILSFMYTITLLIIQFYSILFILYKLLFKKRYKNTYKRIIQHLSNPKNHTKKLTISQLNIKNLIAIFFILFIIFKTIIFIINTTLIILYLKNTQQLNIIVDLILVIIQNFNIIFKFIKNINIPIFTSTHCILILVFLLACLYLYLKIKQYNKLLEMLQDKDIKRQNKLLKILQDTYNKKLKIKINLDKITIIKHIKIKIKLYYFLIFISVILSFFAASCFTFPYIKFFAI